jgi:3-deoxy-D-manno-octulosonate 8-phosphate phosphatase (KDO 8-P phosphatase)
LAVKDSIRSKLRKIRLLLLDVDGVLTDGGIYYSESGSEAKKFNVQDGFGIVKLRQSGIRIGILTGRASEIVKRRARELGIDEVHESLEEKTPAYEGILVKLGVRDDQVAYVGDDEPDLPILRRVGFSAAPADAADVVRRSVDYLCKRKGGAGAVREVTDLLLSVSKQRGDGKPRRIST